MSWLPLEGRGFGLAHWAEAVPLPNQDADLTPLRAFSREHRGAQTFSVETLARVDRFHLDVPSPPYPCNAFCDGSLSDPASWGASRRDGCFAAACCWVGRDGFHRVCQVFVHLPGVRGAVIAELFGLLLLCRRLWQLAPSAVEAGAAERSVHASTPLIEDGTLRVGIDNRHVVDYLAGRPPGPQSPELPPVIRECKRMLGWTTAAYRVNIIVEHHSRGLSREHQLCDRTARRLMQRGRDNCLPVNFPCYPPDWEPLMTELRRLTASRVV